jgi:hypothetical protein
VLRIHYILGWIRIRIHTSDKWIRIHNTAGNSVSLIIDGKIFIIFTYFGIYFRPPRTSIPSRQPGKKEGGVKLLDITEQPMGYAAAKKRKRQQDMEDAKRAAEEAATQVRFSQLPWVIYYNLPSSGFESLKHCCGSGMFIPDPDFYPSRTSDPTATKEGGGGKFNCRILFLNRYRKKFEPIE